uniref:Glycine cleavage system H protein n=1 Tax=Schistocephalus solidus TaxID=70667 RepID=A0A0X3PD49_SCHSO
MFHFSRIGSGFKAVSSLIPLAKRHLSSVKYTKRHEWVSVLNNTGIVGMSKYAVDKLGDIVFIQLPDVGTTVSQDGECGTIESVKAASDFYAPVSGVVKAVNEVIENKPSVLNKSPEDQGWLFEVELTNPVEVEGLMSETEYRKYLNAESKQDSSG